MRGRSVVGLAALVAGVVGVTAASAGSRPPQFDVAAAYAASHAVAPGSVHADAGVVVPPATPSGPCGPGSAPESTQGRAPLADFSDGRALRGYTCNARLISRTGRTGGYRTHSYTDVQGHTCGYFDTTDVYGVSMATHGEYGTVVVDMTHPWHPVQTARLVTQAFAMPHESMTISPERGLLMAAASTNATGPAAVDVYSLKADCRYPELLSSTPLGLLGHEGNVTSDGTMFWVSSNTGGVIAAVDITNPAVPSLTYFSVGAIQVHGLSLSPDGNTLYGAANGNYRGLQIWDVSQIEARKVAPAATLISQVSWPEVSIPQTTMPIVVGGHSYLVEVDEYAGAVSSDPTAPVGAARVIDVQDPAHPRVVSNLRLQVDEPADRLGPQANDPNASNQFVGYAAHYCSVPRLVEPELVACSFLASGLRVFNIHDPLHPVEVAYFNHPQDKPGDTSGSSSFSQPSWDLKNHSVWFADSNHGFFDVQLTNGVWPQTLTAPATRKGAGSASSTAQLLGSTSEQGVSTTSQAYDELYTLMGK